MCQNLTAQTLAFKGVDRFETSGFPGYLVLSSRSSLGVFVLH